MRKTNEQSNGDRRQIEQSCVSIWLIQPAIYVSQSSPGPWWSRSRCWCLILFLYKFCCCWCFCCCCILAIDHQWHQTESYYYTNNIPMSWHAMAPLDNVHILQRTPPPFTHQKHTIGFSSTQHTQNRPPSYFMLRNKRSNLLCVAFFSLLFASFYAHFYRCLSRNDGNQI